MPCRLSSVTPYIVHIVQLINYNSNTVLHVADNFAEIRQWPTRAIRADPHSRRARHLGELLRLGHLAGHMSLEDETQELGRVLDYRMRRPLETRVSSRVSGGRSGTWNWNGRTARNLDPDIINWHFTQSEFIDDDGLASTFIVQE